MLFIIYVASLPGGFHNRCEFLNVWPGLKSKLHICVPHPPGKVFYGGEHGVLLFMQMSSQTFFLKVWEENLGYLREFCVDRACCFPAACLRSRDYNSLGWELKPADGNSCDAKFLPLSAAKGDVWKCHQVVI